MANMIKQSNITFFIFISIMLHVTILSQYQLRQPVNLMQQGQTFSIELSRTTLSQKQAITPVTPKKQTIRQAQITASTPKPAPENHEQSKKSSSNAESNTENTKQKIDDQKATQPVSVSAIKDHYLNDIMNQVEKK